MFQIDSRFKVQKKKYVSCVVSSQTVDNYKIRESNSQNQRVRESESQRVRVNASTSNESNNVCVRQNRRVVRVCVRMRVYVTCVRV